MQLYGQIKHSRHDDKFSCSSKVFISNPTKEDKNYTYEDCIVDKREGGTIPACYSVTHTCSVNLHTCHASANCDIASECVSGTCNIHGRTSTTTDSQSINHLNSDLPPTAIVDFHNTSYHSRVFSTNDSHCSGLCDAVHGYDEKYTITDNSNLLENVSLRHPDQTACSNKIFNYNVIRADKADSSEICIGDKSDISKVLAVGNINCSPTVNPHTCNTHD